MNAAIGWGLAVACIAAGYVGYGWPGVLMAFSVVVFWLLLQFNRALRLMRAAASRPMGHVTSALMLQTQLKSGLLLADVVKLAGSFGVRGPATELPDTELFIWTDTGGDSLQVTLTAGKVHHWQLLRAEAGAESGEAGA